MINSPIARASILGLAHFLVDCTSGFLGASLLILLGASSNFIALLFVYNLIAFALQPALGALVDRFQLHHQTSIWSIAIFAIGLFVSLFNLPTGFLIVAPASALFHVAAGSLATLATPNRPLGAGLFTAPGVFGLALGTIAGLLSFSLVPILIALLSAIAIACASIRFAFARRDAPSGRLYVANRRVAPRIMSASIAIILILLIIFRSATWVKIGTENYSLTLIIILALAAMAGKLAGGVFPHRSNYLLLVSLSLILAGLFVSSTNLILICLGVFALQFSTPIFLWLVTERLNGHPSLASGLVLGLAIFIGGIIANLV